MNNKTFWDAYAELGSKDFKTFAGISKLADNELGYCFATNKSIAEKCGKHFSNISKDISSLIEKGYLFSLEIKENHNTIERRLYTCENYIIYRKDHKNFDNLEKTTYKVLEGIAYLENERKKYPIGENTNTPIGENTNTPIGENANLNISNNNLSNNKSEKSEDRSDSDFEKKYITKPQVVKALAFDRNIILDKNFILELTAYNIEFLTKLFAKVPDKTENKGAYVRSMLKNELVPQVNNNNQMKETFLQQKITESKQVEIKNNDVELMESYNNMSAEERNEVVKAAEQYYLEQAELTEFTPITRPIFEKHKRTYIIQILKKRGA